MVDQIQTRNSFWGITLLGLGVLFLIHQLVLDAGMTLAHDLVMSSIFAFVGFMTYVAYTQNRRNRWLQFASFILGAIAFIGLLQTFFSIGDVVDKHILFPVILVIAGIYLLGRQFTRRSESRPLPATGPEADR